MYFVFTGNRHTTLDKSVLLYTLALEDTISMYANMVAVSVFVLNDDVSHNGSILYCVASRSA